MAKKTERYREVLRALDDWEPYLLRESGLPGPRGNLELVEAVADEGDEALFRRLLANDSAAAPIGSPAEFLAVCGAVGLGRLVAEGQTEHLATLRRLAADPRWRVREGVAMALQRLGDADVSALLREMDDWARGSLLERRAAVAALCEPRLLVRPEHAERVLDLLDRITASLLASPDRKADGFRVLRQALGYGWSVAVVARPEVGKPLLERWLASDDPDVRWVVKENLGKRRLAKIDAEWVAACQATLTTAARRE